MLYDCGGTSHRHPTLISCDVLYSFKHSGSFWVNNSTFRGRHTIMFILVARAILNGFQILLDDLKGNSLVVNFQ